MIIGLEGARFYAYHGFYPEENLIGNWFEVDFYVSVSDVNSEDNLALTLDYQKLYDFTKEVMVIPVKLLETLILKLEEKLKASGALYDWAEVTIRKQTPPGLNGVRNTVVKKRIETPS